MKNIVKLLIRTVVLFLPFIVILILGIIGLISAVVRNSILWVFNRPSYWEVGNEWGQFVDDMERWYKFWWNGIDPGDW